MLKYICNIYCGQYNVCKQNLKNKDQFCLPGKRVAKLPVISRSIGLCPMCIFFQLSSACSNTHYNNLITGQFLPTTKCYFNCVAHIYGMYRALISFRSVTFRMTRLLFWCASTSTTKEMALYVSGKTAILCQTNYLKEKI